MGRINHGPIGDQTGADLERVAAALERLERVDCELEPGDAVFFHCNLLHRSDRNTSDEPRWALICCYNAARNDPYKDVSPPPLFPPGEMARRSHQGDRPAQWERLPQAVDRGAASD